MKKIIFALIMMVMVFGCSKTITDDTEHFTMPKELEGYKIYRLRSSYGTDLFIIVHPDQLINPPTMVVTPLVKNTPATIMILGGKKYKVEEEK